MKLPLMSITLIISLERNPEIDLLCHGFRNSKLTTKLSMLPGVPGGMIMN